MSGKQLDLSIQDIALISLLSATITAGKLALAFIPNVEIVTLLFIVYTVAFGFKKTLLASLVFSTTEILIYGFNTWLLGYYLIWPLLIFLTALVKKKFSSEYIFATLAGLFGLFFGLFFALVESVFYGYLYGLSYWLRGIPFDIVHGASNFIVALLLFKPLKNLLVAQYSKYQSSSY